MVSTAPFNASDKRRSVSRVYGGGAMRGPALIGLQEFLDDEGVDRDGDVTGVSIGSIVAALDTNDVSTERQRQVFSDDLSQMSLGTVAEALMPPLNPIRLGRELFSNPVGMLKSMLFDPFLFTRAMVKEFINLIKNHEMLPADELGVIANDMLRLMGGGLVDLVPVTRALVDRLGLKPNKRLRIVAFDLLSRRPVVFTGTNYDLALALAAACSVPGMMRPVAMVVDGKMCLLVDGGVWHPHPGVFADNEQAIIAKLIDMPGMGFIWQDRPGDFPVTVIDQSAKLFARLSKEEVEEIVQDGYARARDGLSAAIERGHIPSRRATA